MEVKIQSIHFDATEKLQAFIEKKIKKFEKQGDEIRKVEVSLKVVKPETAMNKEAAVNCIPLVVTFLQKRYATPLRKLLISALMQ